jgi:hypothetical protein
MRASFSAGAEMTVAGHNVYSILVAMIAMYFAEFMIYGVIVPPAAYQELALMSDVDVAANGWKMSLGMIGPFVWAIGLSIAIRWRGERGAKAGAVTGLITAAFFMIAARFYQFAYGPSGLAFYALDAAHFLAVGALGGAIIGGWREKKPA